MATYLLTWNPKRWDWDEIEDDIHYLAEQGWLDDRWSCGVTKRIRPGDRFFLMRLGLEPRGIIGSGTIQSSPFEELHWANEEADKGKKANYVDVVFDSLLNAELEPILPIGFLNDHSVLREMNWSPQASGASIPDQIAEELTRQWSSFLRADVIHRAIDSPEKHAKYVEGSPRVVRLTSYERNAAARKHCLQHYGTRCVICGFDFEETYGEVGSGFIHVHHILPLALVGDSYEVDPVEDLRPVCPNCHAIIHRRIPCYTIEEIAALLNT